jgi:hypothetical protein
MKGEVVIRPAAWARIYLLGFSIFWSAFFVQAAVRSPGSQIFGPILIGALGLLFTLRTADEKIVANEGGVFIRNSLRTWRLRWAGGSGLRSRPTRHPVLENDRRVPGAVRSADPRHPPERRGRAGRIFDAVVAIDREQDQDGSDAGRSSSALADLAARNGEHQPRLMESDEPPLAAATG